LPSFQAHAENCGWAMVDADGKSGGVSVGDCSGSWLAEWDRLGLTEGTFINAGCKLPCRYVIQTRQDNTGNVVGYSTDFSTQNRDPGQHSQVTYDSNSNIFTIANPSGNSGNVTVTLIIKDGIATDNRGNSFIAGSQVSTTTNLTPKQYSDLVNEYRRIESATNQRLDALSKSQQLARETLGIERCVTWQGYLEHGTECSVAKAVLLSGSESVTISSKSLSDSIPQSSQSIIVSDTSTSSTDSITVQIKEKNQFSNTLIKVSPVLMEGNSTDIVSVSQKLESSSLTVKGLQSALVKFDAIREKTYSKQVVLPDAKKFDEQAVSESPGVCKIDGSKVIRIQKGICEISYKFTSVDSGNSYTASKSIAFK
jgi:hypothetical protein